MDRARSEGELTLDIISITMEGREVRRNNVEEAGDVERKQNRPHTAVLGDSTIQIKKYNLRFFSATRQK